MLFNEPKLLKLKTSLKNILQANVSVLFNEPKLLKFDTTPEEQSDFCGFSALQRAEIAEMLLLTT